MPAGREPGQRHGSGDEDKHQRHGEQVGASPRDHHYTLSGIVVWHVFEVRCSALGDVANPTTSSRIVPTRGSIRAEQRATARTMTLSGGHDPEVARWNMEVVC